VVAVHETGICGGNLSATNNRMEMQAVGRICARRDLIMGHTIRWVKVKAHSGNGLNERVDQLAKHARPTPFERIEGEQVELIPL
jgi:ribonuclease HI